MKRVARGDAAPFGAGASESTDRDAGIVRGRRTSFRLTAILFAVALSFVLSGGFLTPWMAHPVADGLTVAMIYMFVVLSTAIVLMTVYVYWADRYYDDAGAPRRMEIR